MTKIGMYSREYIATEKKIRTYSEPSEKRPNENVKQNVSGASKN